MRRMDPGGPAVPRLLQELPEAAPSCGCAFPSEVGADSANPPCSAADLSESHTGYPAQLPHKPQSSLRTSHRPLYQPRVTSSARPSGSAMGQFSGSCDIQSLAAGRCAVRGCSENIPCAVGWILGQDMLCSPPQAGGDLLSSPPPHPSIHPTAGSLSSWLCPPWAPRRSPGNLTVPCLCGTGGAEPRAAEPGQEEIPRPWGPQTLPALSWGRGDRDSPGGSPHPHPAGKALPGAACDGCGFFSCQGVG